MKLKLYKARKLEKEIGSLLKEQDRVIRIPIRYKDKDKAVEKLDEAEAKALAIISNRKEMIKLQFEIRKLIEEANFKAGISTLMNERELTQELLREVKINIQNAKTIRQSEESLMDEFESHLKILETPDRYAQTEGQFFFSKKETYEQFILEQRDLKKAVETLNEKLASLNLSKEITLTDSQENLLKEAKLV